MNNSFGDYFKNLILSPRLEEVYQKYLVMKNAHKYVVFVEGYLDKSFYQGLLFNKLQCNFRGDIYSLVCNGKQGVIDISNYLFEKQYLNSKSKKIINIVDRDFNALNGFECKIKEKISLTKYYSIESYAFVNGNIEHILEYLKLSDKNKEHFINNLRKYLYDILDYEALLLCSVRDKFINISTDILDNTKLSIINEQIEINNGFKTAIDRKIAALSNNNLKRIKIAKEMLTNNYLFYRGHDLEKYFDYMMTFYGLDITLSELLINEELTKKFKVEIEIL